MSRELTSSEVSGKGGTIRKTVVRLSSLYRNEPHDEELGNPEPVPGHGEWTLKLLGDDCVILLPKCACAEAVGVFDKSFAG